MIEIIIEISDKSKQQEIRIDLDRVGNEINRVVGGDNPSKPIALAINFHTFSNICLFKALILLYFVSFIQVFSLSLIELFVPCY